MTALITVAVGLAFGFALSRIGFSSWDEVHRMFTFADLRLVLTFAGGVGLLAAAFAIMRGPVRATFARRPIHRGTLAGGLLFGAGWALCGACPSIAFVQLGEGQLTALFTLTGVFVGNAIYPSAHARWFRWPAPGCTD